MAILIKVTQVDSGHNGDNCPVYLALERALPNREIIVGVECWWLDGLEMAFPPKVSQWIRQYDSGITVTPLEFEVQL